MPTHSQLAEVIRYARCWDVSRDWSRPLFGTTAFLIEKDPGSCLLPKDIYNILQKHFGDPSE